MTHGTLSTAAEQLLAIEDIKRTFAARLRCMDTKQWELYPLLHTDDVVSETWGGLPDDKQPQTDGARNRIVGNHRLAEAIRTLLDGVTTVTTVHHGHTPEIELTSDTTATGIWAMEDKLWWRNGDREEHLHGYGHYHEEYRKVGGRWLISYRTLTRLREDKTPGFFDYLRPL
ncbi:nuclear transport factor 2 family protein [Nocardia cyriacigeorgica]|uniref:Nuclear transport factor 2 family protein n=1 Tax=Nocardia cyriacigeorgica TaxID=135487 RepID=A0A6P1DBW0_9NOCA|nr:nuclear transport factor 2 family protein [Nocardia cyriacigeorgica]NEW46290.1 nuclear transport factor 2 family protein [Nocardia cyriacigeorgica]NEW52461.1 nuclear transport factor 2 family protein [Nocardia cyriacigeorgica]NEW58453.1 nuclear transport factor 2 family protein [Nocardia cyriacigeorgica]